MAQETGRTWKLRGGGTIAYEPSKAASVGVTERIARIVADAIEAAEASASLGAAVSALATTASPQSARSVQATENVFRSAEQEFVMLSSTEADAEIGSKPGAGRARSWRRENRALGIERGNKILFPKFQFTREGKVHETILLVLRKAHDQELSQNEVALWLFSPSATLDGQRPVDRLDATDEVAMAFGAAFEMEW